MTPERLCELRDTYRSGLLQDILPFWLRHAVDHEFGGIMTSVDADGSNVDTDKGIWQQGRFAWLLGELINHVEPNETWRTIALQTLDFLRKYGTDTTDGRMWFHVARDGRPIRKRRYAFSESFAGIAWGEAARFTGDPAFARNARHCFQQFVQHNQHPPAGLAKFTSVRPTRGIGFPMITIATAQELRSSIGMLDADAWIDRSIRMIRQYFVKPELQCVMETVAEDGSILNHFDGRTLNPGHAIEGAWFILAEGKYRQDASLIDLGLQMLDWMWKKGWDQEHGGLLYFVSVDGRPVQEYWHEMKFWWPHNELIIATLLAYQLTGDAKYAERHALAHQWAYDHFPDPDQGEWFGYLRRDGSRSSSLKGNLWKGPFHLPRMQLICWQLCDEMLSSADQDSSNARGGALPPSSG
ncbi:MAG: AGE family epimerase/isomerase [Pirellulaceae bacterium]